MVYGEISDGSLVLCHGRSDRAFVDGRASVRDRARQMNAGAACAGGDVRLPLHADTHLPAHAVGLVVHAPRRSAPWGRIDVRTAGSSSILPVIAAWMMEEYMRIAVETGTDMVFFGEHACGHGYSYQDSDSRCYRGADADLWLDLTCMHPSAAGHAGLADLFLAVVDE